VDGAQGPAGPAGPQGASDAYIARNDRGDSIDNPGKTLVTLNLPAGLYAVFGKADVENGDNSEQDAQCTLSTSEYSIVRLGPIAGLTDIEDGANRGEIVVQDLLTLTAPGSVTLSCSTYRGWGDRAKVTAIKVGALHG
jgi:hypothetical protein